MIALAGVVHAHLVSSYPADGDAIEISPSAIRLVFSEPVEAALSRIVVVSTRDSIEAVVHADSLDTRILIAPLPGLPFAGYRVDWRTVSAEGHPVEGSFAFTILAPAGSDSVPAPAPPPAGHSAGPATAAPAANTVVSAILRGLAMFSLLVLAGWLVQLVASGDTPGARRIALLLAAGATVLVAAHALAWLWHVTPPGRPLDPAAALGTSAGRVEAVRLALALFGLLALAIMRGPAIALALALATVVVSGAAGHSAGMYSPWSTPLKGLHLTALAVWMGGVAWLAVAALDAGPFRESAARVSALALGAVAIVALTGLAQAALFLPEPQALVGSAYGRLVLAKAAGLAGLVAFGAHNRRRILPRLAADGDPEALRRSTRRELALMLLVSLVAGVLAYTPPPPV